VISFAKITGAMTVVKKTVFRKMKHYLKVNYNDIIECKNNGNAMNGVGVEIITIDIWNNKSISEAEKGISSSNVDVSSEK
jgi:hypothetical protein